PRRTPERGADRAAHPPRPHRQAGQDADRAGAAAALAEPDAAGGGTVAVVPNRLRRLGQVRLGADAALGAAREGALRRQDAVAPLPRAGAGRSPHREPPSPPRLLVASALRPACRTGPRPRRRPDPGRSAQRRPRSARRPREKDPPSPGAALRQGWRLDREAT